MAEMRSTTGRLRSRSVLGLVLVLVGIGSMTTPAAALLTSNDIGCEASTDITGADGERYHIDARDAEAKVPRNGTAEWRGSLSTATHDHVGEVRLQVGPGSFEVGRWGPSANTASVTTAQGSLELPSFLEEAPAGKYKLTGFHQGTEGGCAGEIEVEVEGTPFSNIAGVSGLLGTGFFGVLLLASAVARKRR